MAAYDGAHGLLEGAGVEDAVEPIGDRNIVNGIVRVERLKLPETQLTRAQARMKRLARLVLKKPGQERAFFFRREC